MPFITDVVNNECHDIKTFADIFAGTGAVSSAFTDKTIITNDLMYLIDNGVVDHFNEDLLDDIANGEYY